MKKLVISLVLLLTFWPVIGLNHSKHDHQYASFDVSDTSGKNVGVNVDDMSIKGFMMTPYFSTTVYDGKKAFDDITILSTELEKNNITSIEEVELKFHIYDVETYDTIADSDPITFSAQ
jgi:hypothetical protein